MGESERLFGYFFSKMAIFFALLISVAGAVPWDYANNPITNFGAATTSLNSLPLSGTSSKIPWSSTYWPNMNAGIANRWAVNQSFNYHLYSLAELQSMTSDQIKVLSPAEKYDILSNRLDYPTVHSEWRRTSPTQPNWYGICHGWAPAAIAYDAPNPVYLMGDNKIVLPWGASDVEALLSYFLAMYKSFGVNMAGTRCEQLTPCPNDLNAGANMIILGNEMGLKSNAFIMDVDPAVQIWNQPIANYSCTRKDISYDTSQITCAVNYVTEVTPTWNGGAPLLDTVTHNMVLTTNAGLIVGGDYIIQGEKSFPDFSWKVPFIPAFSGYMALLSKVYAASIAAKSYRSSVPLFASSLVATTTASSSHFVTESVDIEDAYGVVDIPAYTESSPLYTPDEEADCSLVMDLYPVCDNSANTTDLFAEECGGVANFTRAANESPPLCVMWKVFCPVGYSSVNVTVISFQSPSMQTLVKVYEALDGPLFLVLTGGAEATFNDTTLIPAPESRVVYESTAPVGVEENIMFEFICLQ
jgi:hypothetical protein